MIPMISSFISLWLARLPAAYLIAAWFDKETSIIPIVGWVLGLLISSYLLCKRKMETQKVSFRN